MIRLEVAVCAPVRKTYLYSTADGDQDITKAADYVGCRVLIPFGRRPATGYVLGEGSDTEDGFKIKPIHRRIDEHSFFPPDMVSFFRWVADYYHYPIGLVIKAALPAGLATRPGRTICLTSPGSLSASGIVNTYQEAPWIQRLLETGALDEKQTRRVFSDRPQAAVLATLIEQGIVCVKSRIDRDRVRAKREICYRLAPLFQGYSGDGGGDSVKGINRAAGRRLSGTELKSLKMLGGMQGDAEAWVPRKELVSCYAYGEKILKKLAGEGLVERQRNRIFRNPFGDLLPHHSRPDALSPEQAAVLTEVETALEQRRYEPFLIHGVTGSGKTEVYLQAAEKVVAQQRSVLVLVPEIALATQIEAHFVSRFKDLVALLHSGLSAGERFDEWWRIQSGQAKIVIGARSAVFAPLPDIGLIVVDEEHDSSYKQEDGLRYNGRDLALVRGKMAGSVVILGSATPAVTSHYHSTTSKYRRLLMERRIGERQLPSPLLVDLKESSGKKGFKLFHPDLEKGLLKSFEEKHQSILLLNRRGFSTSVICRNCGTVVECSHCKVNLNRHRKKNLLLCHYCGFSRPGNENCAVCGSDNLQPIGFGTERVEEEVGKLLPKARIARLDSDVAADRKQFLTILQAMRNGEIDVLVGTQIIAKGLHFPRVSLVGIVMADSGLGFPDFRAAEKTYQLITQVTGRAGRGETEGTVIIQTMQPDHYAITLAAENRYEDLVAKELTIRESVGFPPFSRLVFIIVEHPDDSSARQSSLEIAGMVRNWCAIHDSDQALSVLGPAPAPLERLRDRYRWQILIKSKQLRMLHGVTEWVSSRYKAKGQTRVTIDIDPENML
jgi:primosomal protein N' (replication factor Y)